MKIAVIGAGVTGLGAALALQEKHDVCLFEKAERLGGHAHTVTIDHGGAPIDVDTGFIVFNDENYPRFIALLSHLGVPSIETDMSFSVAQTEFEWSSNGLSGLFAWKRNALNPRFLAMLRDIVRFSARARADLAKDAIPTASLGEYLDQLHLGQSFRDGYLLPMGAAIWSTPSQSMLDFPARSFVQFFDNHRLMHLRRIRWRTIAGGSRNYVNALAARLRAIRLATEIKAIKTSPSGVELFAASGSLGVFDHAVFACHTDEAARLLPAGRQRAALEKFRYAPNRAFLHCDETLMPRRRAAWAAWNYRAGEAGAAPSVTYWMNALQNIRKDRPLFITLNPEHPPAPALTFADYTYDHPQFDEAAFAARRAIDAMQGQDRLWFAGAWMHNGFHEDGLRAGLEVAHALGAPPPWDALHGRSAAPLEGAPA